MIPNQVHFVFGLEEQHEPFSFVHYLAIESCRRVVNPTTIFFHHLHVPYGPWWERIAPHLQMVKVGRNPAVDAADYSGGNVPSVYRYAHHADFVRLDALIEHGGIYADIDTVFVRPIRTDLFNAPFVIGREPPVRDERTGVVKPSLCNALMMAEPQSRFATAWRARMPDALNGTWSNHSGFLAQAIAEEMPDEVHVEGQETFFPFAATSNGFRELFFERHELSPNSTSVHLWAHLWWRRSRQDFSYAHERWCQPAAIRGARTTFADLAREYVPESEPSRANARSLSADEASQWIYCLLDEMSGYGVAADRCVDALEASGLEVSWVPFVPGSSWKLGYQPAFDNDYLVVSDNGQTSSTPGIAAFQGGRREVVVAHLVPEYLPAIRERREDAFLVSHTAWETDRIPRHWKAHLELADLIVVPSTFSADAVRRSEVATPVAVLPHVAARLHPSGSRLWNNVPKDLTVFYTIAEWNERKAVFATIEAYLRAFSSDDRVLLIVKTSHRDFRAAEPSGGRRVEPGTTAWALAQLLARHEHPPAVSLVTRPLEDVDIAGLHERGDCFVSLCRGEGWGIGAFDAAAHANPVVTTGYGGSLDYLSESRFLVDYDLVPVNDPAGYPSYSLDQRWAEPDLDDGANALRRVYEDLGNARTSAEPIAREISRRFSPEVIAATLRALVGGANRA
ncbi:MAG: glycosyltransferase [Acidimicrobiales bacterium]